MSEYSKQPRVDIWETEKAFTIEAAIPGVSEKDVHLKWKEGTLTIFAQSQKGDKSSFEPLVREYVQQNFERSFRVSSKVDPEKIEAKIKRGVLSVTLHKLESCQAKQIQVKAG